MLGIKIQNLLMYRVITPKPSPLPEIKVTIEGKKAKPLPWDLGPVEKAVKFVHHFSLTHIRNIY